MPVEARGEIRLVENEGRAAGALVQVLQRYRTSRTAKEFETRKITTLSQMQQEFQEKVQKETGININFFKHIKEYKVYGITLNDKSIWLSNKIKTINDLNFAFEHEMAENMLLNGGKAPFNYFARTIAKIVENKDAMQKYLERMPKDVQTKYMKNYRKQVELAKELICDINGTKVVPDDYSSSIRVRDILGEETINKISKDLNILEKDFIEDNKSQIKFSKEQDKDKTINNLRNELAKDEDKIQATEMWAKRIGILFLEKISTFLCSQA